MHSIIQIIIIQQKNNNAQLNKYNFLYIVRKVGHDSNSARGLSATGEIKLSACRQSATGKHFLVLIFHLIHHNILTISIK